MAEASYCEGDTERRERLMQRIKVAETRLAAIEARANNPVQRVKVDLLNRKIYTGRFSNVPTNYYEWSLEERAKFLSCDVSQLCKSIIFENTLHDDSTVKDLRNNSKYYCVITQYICKIMHCEYRFHLSCVDPAKKAMIVSA